MSASIPPTAQCAEAMNAFQFMKIITEGRVKAIHSFVNVASLVITPTTANGAVVVTTRVITIASKFMTNGSIEQ